MNIRNMAALLAALSVPIAGYSDFGDDGVISCKRLSPDYLTVCESAKSAGMSYSTLVRFWNQNLDIEISNVCGFERTERFDPNSKDREKHDQIFWEIIDATPDGMYAYEVAASLHTALLDFLIDNNGFPGCKTDPKRFCERFHDKDSEVFYKSVLWDESKIKCEVN